MGEFEGWLRQVGRRASSPEEADPLLDTYLNELFLKGEPKSAGLATVYGLCWERGWRATGSTLVVARDALRGWDNEQRDVPRDPPPWEAVVLTAACAASAAPGCAGAGRLALGLLLAFDLYLRPSELLGLRRQDVFLPRKTFKGPARCTSVVVKPITRGEPSKNRTFDNTVVVGEPPASKRGFLVPLLAELVKRAPGPDALLFPDFDLHRLESLTRSFARQAGVEQVFAVPHQCRHGGPSHDALHGVRSLSEVRERGRWLSELSVQRYKKHAMLLRRLRLMSDFQLQSAQNLLKNEASQLAALLRKAL